MAEDELLVTAAPPELARGVAGLEALSAAGLRYPILPYGASQDPTEGLEVSYAPKR